MPRDDQMSQALIEIYQQQVDDLAHKLATGEIDLLNWNISMRESIREAFAMQLIAGAGGDKALVSSTDWLKLGAQVKSQYGFLEDFANEIRKGNFSEDYIAARAEMYMDSSKQMFWRMATGDVQLPAYPADGSSECLGNCGCTWEERGGAWYWVRGKNDSCDTCIQREADWSPYEFDPADAMTVSSDSLDLMEFKLAVSNRLQQMEMYRVLHTQN